MVGPCSLKHGPVPFTVLKNFFVWMLCSHLKTFIFMAGPRFPTSPVTAQLILRRWRIISYWRYADFQQRSNERLVVLPQIRPSSVHGVKGTFCLDVLQPYKNNQVYGWAALPNIHCHGPAYFAALKNRFVLMLCRLSITFKWTAGRVPSNTVERIYVVEEVFRLEGMKLFKNHKTNGWAVLPLNPAQVLSRCWRSFSSGWYAAS